MLNSSHSSCLRTGPQWQPACSPANRIPSGGFPSESPHLGVLNEGEEAVDRQPKLLLALEVLKQIINGFYSTVYRFRW